MITKNTVRQRDNFLQIAHRSFAHHSFAHSLKSLRTNERIAQVAHDKRAKTSAIRSGIFCTFFKFFFKFLKNSLIPSFLKSYVSEPLRLFTKNERMNEFLTLPFCVHSARILFYFLCSIGTYLSLLFVYLCYLY